MSVNPQRVEPIADEQRSDVEATRPLRLFALKHGDTFVVANALGDIQGIDDGMFRDDTRVLSCWSLRVGGQHPSLLASDVTRDNVYFTAHVTNRALPALGDHKTPKGVVHLERTRFVWEGRLYERLTIQNFGGRTVPVPLTYRFAADFADIFEVRGAVRSNRGRDLVPQITADGALLRYVGLDGVTRSCAIGFHPPPKSVTATRADFEIAVADRSTTTLYAEVGPDRASDVGATRFRAAAARARRCMRRTRRRGATIECSGELFRVWLEKSRTDLALLTTELPTGPYPYAGIPWFATTFGRDGIVTALELLWMDPSIARGVLTFLAGNQANSTSAFADSAPGKVLHETRKGEMATLGEVPFGRYFGGVDGTPLFVVLAGAYADRTGDLEFIDTLWPALTAAMEWIEGDGDCDRDGFLDYRRAAESGLANQGWKDSVDSVFHADGRMAEGPIALVEVQGYVFAARNAMATLASRRGDEAAAARWQCKADALRRAVEDRYWIEEERFYGIALDGHGQLCRVCASNAGHLLFTGLPTPDRAASVIQRMLSASFDSGWGLRTLARDCVNYNPMSYHNGSVWPHDTALCAAGFARYGEKEGTVRCIDELFRTAAHFGMRMPELHCGFSRRPGEPPIAYPVACLPQAWSAGAIYMMLQACLGLTVDGWRGEVRIERPHLPHEIDWLAIRGLAVRNSTLDLQFRRAGDHVVAEAQCVNGDVGVSIIP